MNTFAALVATLGDDPLTEHERAIAALDEALPLERYAEICAAILHYRPEDQPEVLARLGADGARWSEIDVGWTDALQCTGYSIDPDLSLRFVRAFMRKRKELRDKNPKLRKLGPLPKSTSVLAEQPAPAGVPVPAPVSAAFVATPSFMKVAAPPSKEPVPPSPPPPGEGPARPPAKWSSETGVVDVSAIVKAVVPFDKHARPTVAESAQPRQPPPRREGGVSTETTAVDVTKILGHSTPFERGDPSQVAGAQADKRMAVMPESKLQESAGAPVGRWVRFDPQTGTPLAEPRWEELPSEEKKT